jgi:hypothetical protein
MFGFFKGAAPSPNVLVDALRPHYGRTVASINSIDGPFPNLFEAGIFISSVATTKILTFKKSHSETFAEQFNNRWVDYLIGSYSVDGIAPEKKTVISRLQEKYPVYRDLLLKTIDSSQRAKAHDNAVQLTWELFSNCTGKAKPDSSGGFLKLMTVASEVAGIGVGVLNAVHE